MKAVRSPEKPFPLPVVVILGPTAVGKSAVSIELAIRLDGEVISADSRAFFRGLDIATDKPSRTVRRGIPHHLIDIIDIDKSYDAMAFRKNVDRLIQEIWKRERLPLVVGGGTLYLGAILRGLFPGPSADEQVRQRLSQQPLDQLYAQLSGVDPTAAAHIHQNDRLRIVRALEVHHITGRPISELQQEATPLPYRFVLFGLSRDRGEHRAEIAARVDRMLERGLVTEVARLQQEGLDQRHQAYRTIGVREVFAFLDGEISRDQLREALINGTWALARRQMTWFRNEKGIQWIDVTNRGPDAVAEEIVAQLRGSLAQG